MVTTRVHSVASSFATNFIGNAVNGVINRTEKKKTTCRANGKRYDVTIRGGKSHRTQKKRNKRGTEKKRNKRRNRKH